MRIGHVVPMLAKRYTAEAVRKRAVFLKGKSGVGKSDTVRQVSALLAEFIPEWKGIVDIRLSQKEPTDLGGVPYVKDGKTCYAPPAWLPAEGTAGIIFFDEITSAPPSIQAAAYQYILDRCLGEHKIPDGWMIVTAGNLTSDRGITFQIAAPLLNRMCEIEVVTTIEDFINHAIPAGCRPEVCSFLKDHADMLHKFEGKGAIEPFPTPRSWFAVSDSLGMDLNPSDRIEVLKGDVGYEAAVAFETHLRFYETLPRIEDILEGKPVKVPKDINAQYAIIMGIASRVNGKTFDNVWMVLKDMPKEIQTLCVKLAYKRDRSLTASKAFNAFAAANQAAFRKG